MNSRRLSIAVTFLTGRYHGEEWPPSPARLYQALVAGVMTCGYRAFAVAVEPALRWLESQAPPSIQACTFEDATPYRIAVPNNDMDVVAREWAAGRTADPSMMRTMKSVRARQVEAEGPHVNYVWQVNGDEADSMIGLLLTAARCLHTLGWGVDMAYADMNDEDRPGSLYEPALSGDRLSVPMPGTLDDLYATYNRFSTRATGEGVDTHTRPSMIRMQPYRQSGEGAPSVAQFHLMKPDTDEVKAVAWQDCMKVAGWLRHAAGESLATEYEQEFVEEYVQGHTQADEKSRRVSFVPVPSISGKYPDGQIRRAMIVEPANESGEVTRMLEPKLTGCLLSDNGGKPVCCLAPGIQDWTFRQYVPRGRARVWRSATPVVLHGYNVGRRGAISIGKTERLLLRSFAMAGQREENIENLAFQSAPLWPGTRHASAMLVPKHLDGYPRLHVEVRFKQGVRGPVLAGIGRHYGIGLFATVDER